MTKGNYKKGYWVRFNNGELRKVKSYRYEPEVTNGHVFYTEGTDYGVCCEENEFVCKKDVIDLIEKCDYVNGYKVIDFVLDKGKRTGVVVDGSVWAFDKGEIRNVITREQIVSMAQVV